MEGQLVRVYRLRRVEGRLAEIDVFLTAHNHGEEVHLHVLAVGIFHPALAKINLGVFTICSFLLHLIRAMTVHMLGDGILLANVHYIVEYCLGTDTRKVRVMFADPVINLCRGQVRMLLQTAMNKTLISVKLVLVMTFVTVRMQKFFLIHLQITAKPVKRQRLCWSLCRRERKKVVEVVTSSS